MLRKIPITVVHEDREEACPCTIVMFPNEEVFPYIGGSLSCHKSSSSSPINSNIISNNITSTTISTNIIIFSFSSSSNSIMRNNCKCSNNFVRCNMVLNRSQLFTQNQQKKTDKFHFLIKWLLKRSIILKDRKCPTRYLVILPT